MDKIASAQLEFMYRGPTPEVEVSFACGTDRVMRVSSLPCSWVDVSAETTDEALRTMAFRLLHSLTDMPLETCTVTVDRDEYRDMRAGWPVSFNDRTISTVYYKNPQNGHDTWEQASVMFWSNGCVIVDINYPLYTDNEREQIGAFDAEDMKGQFGAYIKAHLQEGYSLMELEVTEAHFYKAAPANIVHWYATLVVSIRDDAATEDAVKPYSITLRAQLPDKSEET